MRITESKKEKFRLIFIIGFFLLINNSIFAQDQPAEPQGAATDQDSSGGSPKAADDQIIETEIPQTSAPVMEIRRLDTAEPLYSFELRDAEIIDLFRLLAYNYKLNLLIDKDVQGKITASLSSISLEKFLQTTAESQNLTLEKKGDIIIVKPNLVVRTFILSHVEAKKLLEESSSTSDQIAAGAAAATGVNTIYDLISAQGKILLGTQRNSIVVIDYPVNLARIEEYLAVVDRKMDSRVFKLKYLKADDVVGQGTAAATTDTSAAADTATDTTSATGS